VPDSNAVRRLDPLSVAGIEDVPFRFAARHTGSSELVGLQPEVCEPVRVDGIGIPLERSFGQFDVLHGETFQPVVQCHLVLELLGKVGVGIPLDRPDVPVASDTGVQVVDGLGRDVGIDREFPECTFETTADADDRTGSRVVQ